MTSLNADLEEIVPVSQFRPGFATYASVGWAALMRAEIPIRPSTRQITAHDLIILGGPVWIGRIAAPVRGWLKASRPAATPSTRFATFVTLGGSDPKAAFA